MVPRRFVLAAAGSLAAGLFATVHANAAGPVADPCEGKNPAYCKKDDAAAKPAETSTDCEGKNPLYCKEAPPAASGELGEGSGDGRADSDSRNPARNPNQNPNSNPNRRPPRSSSSGN